MKSISKLLTTLRVLFALQAREVEQWVRRGNLDTPDLTPWIERMVKMTSPLIQEYYGWGIRKVAVQLGIDTMRATPLTPRTYMDLVRDRAAEDGGRSYVVPIVTRSLPAFASLAGSTETFENRAKSFPHPGGSIHRPSAGETISINSKGVGGEIRGILSPPTNLRFARQRKAISKAVDAVLHRNRTSGGFNAKVIDAVNQAALHFCRETIETTTKDVDSALEETRVALRRHLRYSTRYGPKEERGEVKHILRNLAKTIGRIFNDPYRAMRIANTEYQRAINAGAVLEAKTAPFRTVKLWRADAGACKECKKLNGVRRELDQPFIVLQQPGPYAQVQHPPLHPNCDCQMAIQRARRAA